MMPYKALTNVRIISNIELSAKGATPMKQHLIVLDLDGTLLTSKQTISPYTETILMKAKEAGHEVMIATGRPFRASLQYYKQLHLTTPIVNFNGAYIHHPLVPSWNHIHSPISMDVVNDVVHSIHKYEYENLIAEIKDDVYLHKDDRSLMKILGNGDPMIVAGNLSETLPDNPTSLLIHAVEENVSIIRDHLQDVHAELIEHRRWGAPFSVVEVVRKGLNKAVGIDYIARQMGIPRDRIIAFGDEDNDLEMIDYAGVGVVMGNGIDQLKSIANEVTLSNNDDGIGHFLADRLNIK